MARINLQRRNRMLQGVVGSAGSAGSVALFWSDVQYAVAWWSHLMSCLIDMYLRRKTLSSARYVVDFYERQLNMYNLVYNNDMTCIDEFRMNRHAFTRLCKMVEDIGGLTNTKNVLIDEQVAMFLYILAHHANNRIVKHKFKRSRKIISRYFKRVLNAVMRLQGELLKSPEPIPDNSSDERWKWFENCLGALGGTYIKVRVREEDKPKYRSRIGEIATNVLGVCSPDMQFIYILAGLEGSVGDGRVLREAVRRRDELKVTCGNYYLVDASFMNCEGFLAPYRDQQYHLNDWNEGYEPKTPREIFNIKHSRARNVMERAFGLLKTRWAILRRPTYYPIKIQYQIIMACALLHNHIRREMQVDPLENDEVDEKHPDQLDAKEVIDNIEMSSAWTEFRENLATSMFNACIANRSRE